MDPLKLIAILVPEPIRSQVVAEQHHIAIEWGPKHALRTPPHLTIIPPLSVDDKTDEILRDIAITVVQRTTPFNLQLHGYGAFKPRVVFIQPGESDALQDLYRQWRVLLERSTPQLLRKYPDRPYHPHLTLAHRDVAPEQFRPMWNHYKDKSFEASFDVSGFWILNNTTSGWEPETEFQFSAL